MAAEQRTRRVQPREAQAFGVRTRSIGEARQALALRRERLTRARLSGRRHGLRRVALRQILSR